MKIVCLNSMHLWLILLTSFEILTIFPSAHINNLWLILKEGEVCKTSCTIVDDAQMTCNPYYRKNKKLDSNACSRLFIPRWIYLWAWWRGHDYIAKGWRIIQCHGHYIGQLSWPWSPSHFNSKNICCSSRFGCPLLNLCFVFVEIQM